MNISTTIAREKFVITFQTLQKPDIITKNIQHKAFKQVNKNSSQIL